MAVTTPPFAALLYLAADYAPPAQKLIEASRDGDLIVLDLEESVPPERAEAARDVLSASVAALAPAKADIAVRTNALDTEDGRLDLEAIAKLPLEVSIVIPKPVTVETLELAAKLDRKIAIMGEEADFAERFSELAAKIEALDTVIIGVKDLCESLGVKLDINHAEMREVANDIRKTVQASGLRVFDGVAFGPEEAFHACLARSKAEGFDGASLMRPRDFVAVAAGN